jgi:hypothetical protein
MHQTAASSPLDGDARPSGSFREHRRNAKMLLQRLLLTAPIFLPFVLVACATASTAPSERMESSSAAILAAENGGAAHSADADVYLRLARDEYAYSQRLPNPNDKDRVDRLLRRAQVDAELSLALAHGEEQKAAAKAAIDKVTQFNREARK